MFLHDERLVLSATDVTRHVGCAHATTLEREVAAGRREAPQAQDVGLQLVTAMGEEHERSYLQELRDTGRRVVEIPRVGSWAHRERLTLEAMHGGADVVYQATLFDGGWLGHADFLLRAERPSRLGGWSYDIADTKLARHLSVDALLQMAGYAVRLEQLQGAPCERLTVVGGDGSRHDWRPVDVMAYATRMRSRLVRFLAAGDETDPAPSAACGRCRWIEHCTAHWDAVDDLSRVAGLRGDHRAALRDNGIATVAALAATDPESLRGVLSSRVRDRLVGQARLQVQERETGVPAYELLAPESGRGLQLLPEPDEGDVYLDFEGDPFADGGRGREYLAGIWTRDGDYLDWWAHDAVEEARLTGELLDWLVERWREHPGMHVYHYAAYEVSALKRMTGQHAVGESGLDQLLRGGRFVDLYQVVRQGLRISKPSYSIKKVEDFYWHQTRTAAEGEVADGMASVVEYERWLAEGRADDGVLQAIRRYNREDVRSTHALHEWLEQLRAELAAKHPDVELGRPAHKEAAQSSDNEKMLAEARLAEQLLEARQPLLAGLVGWHRREDKPRWWDYYRTETMSVEELLEDGRAIGEVGPPAAVGAEKRSTIWEYRFPPQDAVMTDVGQAVSDARTHESAGSLVAIDVDEGWVRVKRASNREPLLAEALVQREVVQSGPLQDSLARLGAASLAGGDELGLRLVRGVTPVIPERSAGETAGDLMRRVGRALDGEVLAVQGPPGAGKSHNGALLIQDLLDAGKRVGVTAQSHRVIADLMARVGRPGVRKGSRGAAPSGAGATVRVVATNDAVDEAVAEGATLVGGTAWLWAREEMRGAVDVLVVDEAGQFSLANAAAVAQGARSMVLLGDPQQLRSPTQAVHPWGAGVSALEHLLDGRETIDPTRGVFLDRTWRMHPQITSVVSELAYEGRLGSDPCTAGQAVDAPGRLTGAGLRWVPVPHLGNTSCSVEEATVVRGLVDDLLRGRWVDGSGTPRPLAPQDILVVAPFNAHVAELRAHLPADVPVGTVDRFQGHEGAVVIYAMAASTAEDAPRGVGFLYDVHRLNVAISRARALAVVVGSPALLEAPVASPEQLRAVNALCRFVDEATHA